jgi:hypothetical protein
MFFRRLGWPLAGAGIALALSKFTEREKYFVEYCAWCDKGPLNEIPSLLYERLKHLYGEEFADTASDRARQDTVRGVLHKLTMIKFWFANPMELLREAIHSEDPSAN